MITAIVRLYSTCLSVAHLSVCFNQVCELDAMNKGRDADGMSFDCQLFVESSYICCGDTTESVERTITVGQKLPN